MFDRNVLLSGQKIFVVLAATGGVFLMLGKVRIAGTEAALAGSRDSVESTEMLDCTQFSSFVRSDQGAVERKSGRSDEIGLTGNCEVRDKFTRRPAVLVAFDLGKSVVDCSCPKPNVAFSLDNTNYSMWPAYGIGRPEAVSTGRSAVRDAFRPSAMAALSYDA